MTAQATPRVSVSDDRRRVVADWPDGQTLSLPAPWIYDNAEDACDAVGGNRRSGGLALAGAETVSGARLDGEAIAVRFEAGGEERRVPLAALMAAPVAGPPRPGAKVEFWTSPERVAAAPPFAFDAYLGNDYALARVLGEMVRHGVAFLTGAGTEPGAVERAVARFGFIRETNYGRLFDVREEARPSHLAYTAVGLELHTDNPYRDPVPTLQLLHVIEAASDGGESLFADGFAHAEALRAVAPERFEALATTLVEFAYEAPSRDRYAARAPVLETDAEGAVTCVRLNHRALRAAPLARAEAWYEAYIDLYQRVHAPGAHLRRMLAPGDLVIFDNRRLLHGRASYHAGGRRWLQGCYAERDGLMATLSRLSRPQRGGGK